MTYNTAIVIRNAFLPPPSILGICINCTIPTAKKPPPTKYISMFVNIASAAGFASLAEMGPYNVTKAGVISLTETLRMELAGQNIGVTAVTPTFFKTNLMDQVRYTDEHQLKMADAFFEKALCDANHVSKKVIRAIMKNQLYVLPQFDARLYFRFKRLAPQTFFGLMGKLYSKGWLDKFLGI